MKTEETNHKTIMIVAGEASGDMHGAHLVREMLKIDPLLRFYGIGGNKMKAQGVELLAAASDMAVVGLTEVVFKLKKILHIMRMMKKSMDERRPDLVILIDYPDFNLALAKAAAKKKLKVFYYISPQVWAWRKGRIKQIKETVSTMAVILPFEVETYRHEGFEVNYVGHPLLDVMQSDYSKKESRKKFGLAEDKTTVGILPGSRLSEIKRLLPELLQAGCLMIKDMPDLQFILPLADTLEEKSVKDMIDAFGIDIKVVSGCTYEVISCADLALVCSGTATLETGLLKVPMVIVYKISLLSYLIGRLFVRVKNIGLVNIVAGKTVVPELVQRDASGPRIAREALSILKDENRKRQIAGELEHIRAKLGKPGTAERTAQLAVDML